ncbi:MAG: cytochrome C [Rhodobacterales bacterium]|nr:cytochrome C [Rhodobacterales bacterium]
MRASLFAGFAVLQAGAVLAEPSLERGTYLVEGPSACGNCHTPLGPTGPVMEQALGGRVVEQSEAFTAIASNITPGGRVAGWSDAELVKAIREGIRPDGTVIGPPMPIGLYRGLSDDDVQSIVMYLRQVPAVDLDPGQSVYNIPLPPAYGPPIDTVAAIPQGVTVVYGAYLANAVSHCMECHTTFGPQGPMFDTHLGAGGFEFHGPWGTVVAPNITSGPEGIGKYSDAELVQIIQHGVRPDGAAMLPPMPYGNFAAMTDDDVAAVILYLRSLPALPFGG